MVLQGLTIILKRKLWVMGDKYILDANIFITSHRQLYPFDIAPSFWDQLVEKASDKIIIIEEVQKELLEVKIC